jgi:hypothetical protein
LHADYDAVWARIAGIRHVQNWHKPVLHMHVVRVLWMVPIYAGASWLALCFFHEAFVYINAVRECHEARHVGLDTTNRREARRLEHRTARPQGRWWHWRLGLPARTCTLEACTLLSVMYLTLARDRST